ncbi:hypothetical protein [Alkalibacter mobilis]|uniref:hypothetical protein n=1 Tax=Alkalibacter mobilis TaxID=2787712 RepID=UPI0018A0E7EC|nr:hypothetical protein [Alkalibacter mobilis]MBF7096026.1 hypothetical protein [Alkalibacter mobilis]
MNSKIQGYIMAAIGFGFLVFSAANYISDGENKTPAFLIMGLVFVVIGMKKARNAR